MSTTCYFVRQFKLFPIILCKSIKYLLFYLYTVRYLKVIKLSKSNISEYLEKYSKKYNIDLNYYIGNGFWVSLAYVISSLSGVAVSVAFANLTTKEIYGQYSLILSIISILGIISLPGLATSVVQSVARGYDKVFWFAVKKRLKYSILIIIIAFFISIIYYYISYNVKFSFALILTSLFFPFINVLSMWQEYLQGKSQFRILSFNNMFINVIVSVVFILTIYFYSGDIVIIMFSYVFTLSIFNIFYVYKYKKELNESSNVDKESIKYGYFLTKLSVLELILNHIDKIIIGVIDIKLLALYVIALKLLELIKGGSKSFYKIILPKFATFKINARVSHLIILAFIGLFLSIILYFSIEFIVISLYTNAYIYSAYFFKKIIWVSVLFLPISYLHSKFMGESNRKVISFIRIYNPVLSLVVCISVYLITNSVEYFVLTKVYFSRIINIATLYFFNFNTATK